MNTTSIATDIGEEIVYTAVVGAVSGRSGTVRSETGQLSLDLARPADRGTGAGTDPEELFAAGYAACFDSALAESARRGQIKVGATVTTASVSLIVAADQTYRIAVALHVTAPNCEQEDLARAVEAADRLCPYSRAIRGNVDVTLTYVGLSQPALPA